MLNRAANIDFSPRGFSSLAEIVLVVGIMSIILMISILSFPRIQQSSSLTATTDTFLADFKAQQLKAMNGDSEGAASADNYGIHFDTTSYTLFRGDWSGSDPDNFTLNLPNTINVTTSCDYFGEKMVRFIKGSGEIASWNSICTITFVSASTGDQKTISVEKLGSFTLN